MDLLQVEAVLDFWFGALDAEGRADEKHQQRWWSKDPALDAAIRDRFLPLHTAILRGEREAWLAEQPRRLAYVVVLDQFSRNMFRGTPAMFSGDERALSAALGGIEQRWDKALPLDERAALYLPLMHSERLDMQQRCIQLYANQAAELPEGEARASIENRLAYAVQHRDIVQRFGRFPHRNEVLGRASSAAELEFLRQPGSSF